MHNSLSPLAMAITPLALLSFDSASAADIQHRVVTCANCDTGAEFRNRAAQEANRWRINKGMLVVTSQNAAQSALFRIKGIYVAAWGTTVYQATEISMGGRETLDTMLLGRPAIGVHDLTAGICDCQAAPGNLEKISAYLATLHLNTPLGSKVTVVYPDGSRGSFKKILSSIPFVPIWTTFVDAEGRPIPGLNPEAPGKNGRTTSNSGPVENPYPVNPYNTGSLSGGRAFVYSFGWFSTGYYSDSRYSFGNKW